MRAFIVKIQASFAHWENPIYEDLPSDFLLDVIRSMKSGSGDEEWKRKKWFETVKRTICDYHDHDEPNPESGSGFGQSH